MNLLAPVKDIMITNVITIHPDAPIAEAEAIFNDKGFHHLPVVKDGRLVGIVSKSDFAFFRKGLRTEALKKEIEVIRNHDLRVRDFMTSKLATIEPKDKINVALEVFKANMFHAIPIVENDELKGIITTLDIIKHLAEDKGANAEYVLDK